MWLEGDAGSGDRGHKVVELELCSTPVMRHEPLIGIENYWATSRIGHQPIIGIYCAYD